MKLSSAYDYPASTNMPPASDLVRDSKFETEFIGEDTQHILYQSTKGSEQEKIRVEELWKRVRKIGDGTYGKVWLEACCKGPRAGELRAVKEIPKIQANQVETDYTKELEAITTFSQAKVSTPYARTPPHDLSLTQRQAVCTMFRTVFWVVRK